MDHQVLSVVVDSRPFLSEAWAPMIATLQHPASVRVSARVWGAAAATALR